MRGGVSAVRAACSESRRPPSGPCGMKPARSSARALSSVPSPGSEPPLAGRLTAPLRRQSLKQPPGAPPGTARKKANIRGDGMRKAWLVLRALAVTFLAVPMLGLAVPMLMAGDARAEIFVSANDGKQRRPDDITFPDPDSLSILDVTANRVRLLGSAAVTSTLTGPPTAVAVTRD